MLVLAEYVEARSSRQLGPAIPRMINWTEHHEDASKSWAYATLYGTRPKLYNRTHGSAYSIVGPRA